MSITQKQLDANRNNAQKGGVKTTEGKAVSRYNAIRHGLLSKEVLLADEDAATFEGLCKRLRSNLAPANELELILVDRIATSAWRLRRALQIERQMIEDERKPDMFDGEKNIGEAFSKDSANHDSFGKFVRYETSIERGMYKALHELQRLQAARKGEPVAAPVAIDIDNGSN